jgi:methionine S-methyltransferase
MAAPVAINSKDVDAFLASCAPSGDAAYGAAKAVLQRLHDPASRAGARRLLGAVRRRFADGQEDECARTFHFRIREVVLDPHLQGLSSLVPTRPNTFRRF